MDEEKTLARRIVSLVKPSIVPIRFIDVTSYNLFRGRAISEALLKLRQADECGDTFYLFNPQWSEPKCTGDREKLEEARGRLEALGIEYCRSYRRGGLVIWNRNMVSAQIITKGRFVDLAEAWWHWMGIALRTLKILGIVEESLSFLGNNLRVDGKKVGGATKINAAPVHLTSFSLYLDCDYNVAQTIFADENLRKKITTLKEVLGREISSTEVKTALFQSCQAVFSLQPQEGSLTPIEEAEITKLEIEKYHSKLWNEQGVFGEVS